MPPTPTLPKPILDDGERKGLEDLKEEIKRELNTQWEARAKRMFDEFGKELEANKKRKLEEQTDKKPTDELTKMKQQIQNALDILNAALE